MAPDGTKNAAHQKIAYAKDRTKWGEHGPSAQEDPRHPHRADLLKTMKMSSELVAAVGVPIVELVAAVVGSVAAVVG